MTDQRHPHVDDAHDMPRASRTGRFTRDAPEPARHDRESVREPPSTPQGRHRAAGRAKRAAQTLGLKPVLSRARDRSFPVRGGGSMLLTMVVGRFPSASVRTAVYRLMGLTVGRRAHIYGGMEIRAPGRITIGDGSVVGLNAILDGREGITIGRNVNLSSDVAIWTLQHDLQDSDFGAKGGPVVVEDRAWLSFRCTVLPGVTIGEGAVVAAGSIVTKDVAPFAIVAGIPAQQIGERNRDLTYELGHAPTYWFV